MRNDTNDTSGGTILIWDFSKGLCINVHGITDYWGADGVGRKSGGGKQGQAEEDGKEKGKIHVEGARD